MTTKTTAGKKSASKSGKVRRAARARSGSRSDAISLLEADHREVEGWFEQFEKARSNQRKLELAQKICSALRLHTAIEEEVFYPAFLEATDDKELHHEAEVEHSGAKKLIAQIEASGPEDEYYDAKVKVLSEMIKHHVKEEEQRGGMFAEARKVGMDLKALGEELRVRKTRLENGAGAPRSRRSAETSMTM
jgi:hemerythrin superfamily protein